MTVSFNSLQNSAKISSFKTYKLIVLGFAGVGHIIHNQFIREYLPTMEDPIRKQCTIDGHECFLDIVDTLADVGLRE